MNRDSIARFASRAARHLADTLGTLISVNGGPSFFATVNLPQPVLDLETGGWKTTTSLSVRWPADRAARPALGSVLLLVDDGVSYRVETAVSLPGSPLSGAEVHVTAARE